MGVKGIRAKNVLPNQFKEPDLITDVNSIIKDAVDKKFIDGKGNLKLDQIAANLNINVVYEILEPEVSGYFKSKNGIYYIGINSNHNKRRQRFTLAHELGHFYLHKSSGDVSFQDEVFFRVGNNPSSIEYAANEFAARLLIPQDRFEAKLKEGMRNIPELAEFFEVSIPAIQYRAISLGYKIAKK